jgi:hypothetical protein
MHWYNPKSRVAESVPAPYTDEEAQYMLEGDTDSWGLRGRVRKAQRRWDEHRAGHDLRGTLLSDVALKVPAGRVTDGKPKT